MSYAVYVVGGFVRDLMLDAPDGSAPTLDVDIVIEGDAIAFARRMQALYGGRVVEHKRFGTAKWQLSHAGDARQCRQAAGRAGRTASQGAALLPSHLDFVTARTEFYTEPTALPTVQQSSIKLDLHRRDFTINTLALALNPDRWGELLDFWGGLADLRGGWVRVLHSLSFVDDPTAHPARRALRAALRLPHRAAHARAAGRRPGVAGPGHAGADSARAGANSAGGRAGEGAAAARPPGHPAPTGPRSARDASPARAIRCAAPVAGDAGRRSGPAGGAGGAPLLGDPDGSAGAGSSRAAAGSPGSAR